MGVLRPTNLGTSQQSKRIVRTSLQTLAASMKIAYLLSALAVAMLATSVQGRSCRDDSAVCKSSMTA